MHDDTEPLTEKALVSEGAREWMTAMKTEVNSLETMHYYEIVTRPKDKRVLH